MKHIEVYSLYNKLTKLNGLQGFKLNYAIKRNEDHLSSRVKILDKLKTDIVEMARPYDIKRDELLTMMADGNKKQNDNGTINYEIKPEKHQEALAKLKELDEEYKDLIAIRTKELENYVKYLENEESDFIPYTIDHSDVPNTITTEQMDALYPLLKPDEK